MTENMLHLKTRQRMRDMFGKDASEMDLEELLNAVAVVSDELYEITRDARYGNLSECAYKLLAKEIRG